LNTQSIAHHLDFIEWVSIPAGKVEDQNLDAFRISKYPVTNAQYLAFEEDGGYDNPHYWTETGWQWKTRFNIFAAMLWRYNEWRLPNYPIVGVSWYEAIAFCKWLSEKVRARHTSPLQTISLPTEQQWQRAAQGEDGRRFPWGNNFDPRRCNTAPNRLGRTSAVDAYPDGASPFGVYDLVGNVFEWCLNEWDNPKNLSLEGSAQRVLKGGSWVMVPRLSEVTYRSDEYPYVRSSHIGFRVVG
jgi:formylglycine-generating enzyme required for sulfatase activity